MMVAFFGIYTCKGKMRSCVCRWSYTLYTEIQRLANVLNAAMIPE